MTLVADTVEKMPISEIRNWREYLKGYKSGISIYGKQLHAMKDTIAGKDELVVVSLSYFNGRYSISIEVIERTIGKNGKVETLKTLKNINQTITSASHSKAIQLFFGVHGHKFGDIL